VKFGLSGRCPMNLLLMGESCSERERLWMGNPLSSFGRSRQFVGKLGTWIGEQIVIVY